MKHGREKEEEEEEQKTQGKREGMENINEWSVRNFFFLGDCCNMRGGRGVNLKSRFVILWGMLMILLTDEKVVFLRGIQADSL